MYKKLITTLILLLAFNTVFATSDKSAISQIKHTLNQSMVYWNKGNINEFMSIYKNSDSTLYVSANVVHGYQHIKQYYFSEYPSPENMGKLSFSNLDVKLLSPQYAIVIGNWHLIRPHKNAEGVFTLLYERTNAGWKIIVDHSS